MDEQAPATKGDIAALMESIGNLYMANERWKDEILANIADWKEEIIRHFDVVVEDIRHDLEGANRDEIELLKDARTRHDERITRLEKYVGIVG